MRFAIAFITLASATVPLLGAPSNGEAHASSPSVFAGTFAQSIAAALVFLILLTLLWKFAWGPILSGLQDRERKIKDDLDEAERANKEAKQTLAQYESKLAEAQAEARKMLEQAHKDADELRAQLTAETEQQIAALRQRATEEIRLAKQQAVQDLYAQTAQLATAVAGKILGRQINEADADRLLDESVKELGELKAG